MMSVGLPVGVRLVVKFPFAVFSETVQTCGNCQTAWFDRLSRCETLLAGRFMFLFSSVETLHDVYDVS